MQPNCSKKKPTRKFEEKIYNEMTITKKLMRLKQYLVQLNHHDVLHKLVLNNTIKSKKLISFLCLKNTHNIFSIIFL